MEINQQQRDNLSKALSLFIEGFRPYVASLLMQKSGDQWPAEFFKCLNYDQQRYWNEGLRSGREPVEMIDYKHFKSFSIVNKDLLKADFGKKANDLPNWLGEITEVRNVVAHYDNLEADEATKAWIHMKTIARLIKMPDLEAELTRLQDAKPAEAVPHVVEAKPQHSGRLQPWFQVVTPHFDIKQGRLDESVFAANLADVALNTGPEIYNNADAFFEKTFFTTGLKNVARTVIKGLNGKEDAENRVISLQTGFGGGKTHTLISLYHVCKRGRSIEQTTKAAALVQYTGLPEFDTANIAVFTNTTNDAANGRTTKEGILIQTIWGELAYQLGGVAAYEIIRKNDEQLIAPAGLFKKVLEQCKPALILIDELADYCVKASGRKVGNSSLADQTISFMQELTEAVAGTNNCVALITLPASPQEVGNTPEAQAILNSLQKRVSRVGADTQPVADEEIYEVIRRRLFEEVGDENVLEATASKYLELYQQLWTELPGNANKTEYKQKIIKSYPFHPELIDIFKVRWASHHDFQRTRGVLRLLAAIVSDLWKRQQSLTGPNLLIHSGHINLSNLDALTGQLKRLYGNGYDAVISADVSGSSSNAFKVDSNKREYGQWYLTQSIATVILMNSFGSDGANKGLSIPDIKLHLLVPDGFNHNSINGALDELESSAYYLYYAQTGGAGKRYWFHTKPNINILINQAKSDIQVPDIEAEVIRRIKEKERFMHSFNVLIDPLSDIPEQLKPTLIILSPKYLANPDTVNGKTKPVIEKLATKKGNSERIYRNTILFLLCSEIGISKLHSDVREFLACQKIGLDYGGQIEKDQKDDIKRRMDEASRQSDVSIVTAYSILAKYSVKNGVEKIILKQFKDSLDSQVNNNIVDALKEEEWLLNAVGLNTLRNNNLLPTLEQPIKAKDVYEAFLRYDDKPMITGEEAVSKSLLRFCNEGQFCIASGDGVTFEKYYLKEIVPFFEVTESLFWLVDKSLKPQPQPAQPTTLPSGGEERPSGVSEPTPEPGGKEEPAAVRAFREIIISGKVPLERYHELFNYFITPFAMNGNKIDIEVQFRIKSSESNPLDENKQQYKNAKEAASQLGLKLDEELR
ncbi:DUF499 domain-containing protein [Flavisolibacter sp. BT320]|nr:DUF499 domain-containing protein [Flavisolibacter longurius]